MIDKWKLKGMKYDQYVKNTVNEKTDTGLLQVSREIFVFIMQNAFGKENMFIGARQQVQYYSW